MSLIEMASEKIVGRSLRYIGVALLAFLGLFIAVVASNGARDLPDWLTVGVFSAGLCWITIKQAKQYWHRVAFWFAMTVMLTIHLAIFLAILRIYPDWRPIWFAPIVLGEGAFLPPVLLLLLRRHRRR